jgi:hypothetical protein
MPTPAYDIVVIGDFRFPGGTSTAVAAELRALATTGYSVGLYHQPVPQLTRPDPTWHPEIRAEIGRHEFAIIPAGQSVDATLVVAHSPWLFSRKPRTTPAIRSRVRLLVVHALPTDAQGQLLYDPWTIDAYAREALGGPIVWAPNTPTCRASLDRTGMPFPRLAEDWTNIIFVDDWGRARDGLLGAKPVIGRHSLARPEKWPDSLAVIRQAYRPGEDLSVRFMGVHASVFALVGGIPSNWKVFSPNEIPVREFLGSIDFFVYYHHRDWIETFGRAPAEAISAGCVAILPPYFEATFGPAAVYCEASEAIATVEHIAASPGRFAELSRRGRAEIDRHYGPVQHLERLKRVLTSARAGDGLTALTTAPTAGLPSRTAILLARAAVRARTRIKRDKRRARGIARRIAGALGRGTKDSSDPEI